MSMQSWSVTTLRSSLGYAECSSVLALISIDFDELDFPPG